MKNWLRTGIFWGVTVFVWELVFHMLVWKSLSRRFLYSLMFILSLALFLTALSHLWRWPLANRLTGFLLALAGGFLFCVQTVYFRIFDTLLSATLVEGGGEAITNFFDVMMKAILRCLPLIIVDLLPCALLPVLDHRGTLDLRPMGWRAEVTALCVSVLIFSLGVPGEYSGSEVSRVYYDHNATVDRQTEYFGLLNAERLELKRMSSEETGLVTDVVDLTGGAGTQEPDEPDTPDEPDAPPEPELPPLNILEALDFDVLAEKADTEQLRELTTYFSGLTGTRQNEYTGLFKGFNLIEICAESYCSYVVDPELTPALWRLTHEGIVFDNFYCSFNSTTTNGEYCLNMGLLPDLNRMSFNMSQDNYLPFTMAHMLEAQGVHPMGYHNNTAYFYGRINSHPNMGFDFKAIEDGLELTPMHPYSDLEMLQVTLDDYLEDDRFFGYYMTYSGHHPYMVDANDIVKKNLDDIPDTGESLEVRGYRAANLELERALEYLLERLEKEDLLDKTVIVLTGDHYPYGLSEELHQELAGETDDPFWRYRNSFICWSGAIKEPIHVDSFCCTQDILPTLLNLFGLPYDSRLLTGTDVLSDSTHIAVLQTGSFRTKDILYDADTSSVTYLTPMEQLPIGYADGLIRAVKNQFSVAASVLRSDYYGFAFETLGLGQEESHDIVNATFSDTRDKWYRDSVELLARKGGVWGDKLDFQGDLPVTRGEVASMLTTPLGLEAPETDLPEFTDLPPEEWQYAPMSALWKAGLLEPQDGAVRPEDIMTIEELRDLGTRMAAYFGLEDDTAVQETVSWIVQSDLESGGTGETLTRGMAAAFVASFLEDTEE